MISQTTNKKWCVYEHVFPNGKRYIGITSKRPKARWQNGQGYMNKNNPMYRAIQKYGWDNIEHNILFTNLTQIEACEIEQELIAKYKTNVYKYGSQYGYNLTDGGEGTTGHVMPPKQKEANRLRKIGKTGAECPNSRPVICDGVEYASVTEFKQAYNHPKGNIIGWLNGKVGMPEYWYNKRLHYKDLGFDVVKLSQVSVNRYRKVVADDIVFDTLEDCGNYLGVTASSISLYLTNRKAPPNNIIEHNLRYEDEDEHIFKQPTRNHTGHKIQYECDNQIFYSQAKLADYLQVKPATLNSWLRGKNPMPIEIQKKNIKRIK